MNMTFLKRLTVRHVSVAAAGLALVACETIEPAPRPSPQYPDRGPVIAEPLPEIDEEEFVTVPQRERSEVVRVAILLPFSNSSENIETVSASMLKAAQMVAFESDNAKYLLIPKDTKGTPEGAAQVAREAMREGAEIILGPLFADSVEAVAQIARPLDIPVIAFSTDSHVAGDGVYLLSFPPEAEIARVTDYAISKGYARFGLMAPFTDFGDRVANAFSSEVYTRGGDIVHTERYERSADAMIDPARRMAQFAVEKFEPAFVNPRPTTVEAGLASGASMMAGEARTATQIRQEMAMIQADMTRRHEASDNPMTNRERLRAVNRLHDLQSELTQLASDDPFTVPQSGVGGNVPNGTPYVGGYQAVLLPEQGRLLRALAPLFPYYDVNVREVKLLGLSAWNNPLLTREPALSGGWFAAPDPALAEGFKRRYERAYGEQPPRLASLAYDAALLTARLSQLPAEKRFAVATIANPNGYLGADGLFRLRPDGMVERGLAILEIRQSGITVIDPAPRSFATQIHTDSTGTEGW